MLQDGASHSGSSVGENPVGELGRSGSRMKRGRNSCCSCCRSGLVWHGHRRGKTKAPDKALSPIMRTSEAIKGVGSWWVSSGYPQEGSVWAYRTRCSNKCFVVQKSQEGWGVGENSLTNSNVRASCWRRDLRAWWGTELDLGKASLCGSRAGNRATSDVTVPGGTDDGCCDWLKGQNRKNLSC